MRVQCFLCVVYLAYCFIVFIPLGLFLYVLSLYGLFFVIIFHVLCLSTASTLFLASLSSLYRIFLHVLISYSRCIVRSYVLLSMPMQHLTKACQSENDLSATRSCRDVCCNL